MQETWVRSLGWQDPLEEEMITHSSILAWRIPWIEEPGGLQSMWLQRVRHNWVTNTFTFLYTLGLHLGRQVMSIWVGMHRRVMSQNIHLQIQLQPVHMLIFETLKKVQKAFTNTYKKQHRLWFLAEVSCRKDAFHWLALTTLVIGMELLTFPFRGVNTPS